MESYRVFCSLFSCLIFCQWESSLLLNVALVNLFLLLCGIPPHEDIKTYLYILLLDI